MIEQLFPHSPVNSTYSSHRSRHQLACPVSTTSRQIAVQENNDSVATLREGKLAINVLVFLCFLFGLTTILPAAEYPDGFVWQRSENWTLAGTVPDQSSKNDRQGNAVWGYTYVNGGSSISDPGSDKWWQLGGTDLTAGTWYGSPVFLYGIKLPYFAQAVVQVSNNDVSVAPLAVWKNPAGDGVSIRVGGSVGWSGPGGGTNTITTDYVLALHRVVDDSWQILDSAVFAPPGSTTPTNIRDYSAAEAFAPVTLSAGDEIVWGFKRSANFNGGITWMNMIDSLIFTRLESLSVADITVVAPTSESAEAAFTVALNEPMAGTVTVDYATADDAALAGNDYAETTGTLAFAPGEVSKTVSVTILASSVPQAAKSFILMLSNPVGISHASSSARCTILNNVPTPASGFTASQAGIAGIDLTWIEGGFLAPGYLLERAIGVRPFEMLAEIPVGTTHYRDTGVKPGLAYSYRLVSHNEVVAVATANLVSGANAFPPTAFQNVRDYGTMWWRSGVRGERIWQIKTSRYAMTFDCDSLNLSTIFPLATYLPEETALVQPNDQSFPTGTPATSLSCTLTAAGTTVPVRAKSNNNDDAHLLESGKFYQRRWQKIKTTSGPALSATQSGLEICAWPDRVSIVCRVVPTTDVAAGGLDLTLDFQDIYEAVASRWGAHALAAANGSGFVVLKSAGSDTLTVDPVTARVSVHTDGGNWQANQERSVGLVIYPSMNATDTFRQAIAIESGQLMVTANQVVPVAAPLVASYDADRGYYQIPLRTDVNGGDPDRVERSRIVVTNGTAVTRPVRFAFTKSNPPYAAGVTCLIRDADGNPLGIPVQLSKNWHVGTGDRWEGPWFHGLTMFTVPANTTLAFEVLMAGQNYGGVPAASHAQLCLVGWGGNQQWEEAAIGCWGESLCYDPDSDLAKAIGTDSRPLLLLSSTGAQKQWTGNYGGCDFLRYYSSFISRRYQKRIRTRYQRYGPNLTDVTYAGLTDDSKIEYQYSASLYRSNDITRGLHRIRYDVKSDTPFNRMVFFQLASDNYNYNGGNTHAYGYGDQSAPAAQWTTTNVTTPTPLTGNLPWFSTLNCPVDSTVPSQTGATRGFIVRSWNARINGQDGVAPHFVSKGSCLDLVPPPGVSTLKAGDYVEAEIERVYFGQAASAYYGGDANLTTAMQTYGNTHEMVMREAIGNQLTVAVTNGSLENSYPIRIQTQHNQAQFSVTGGLGYVPMTFTAVTDYRNPLLEEKVGRNWIAIDQSAVGKDFWQADYDPVAAAWEITFNVKLDAAYQDIAALRDAPVTRTFRFRQAGAPTATIIPPGAGIPGVPSQLFIVLVAGDLPVSGVAIQAISSNEEILPTTGIVVSGNGPNRTLSFTSSPGQVRPVTITIDLYLTDSEGKTSVVSVPYTVDAYEAWKQRFFSGINDPDVIGDACDPDGDGRSNIDEYAAGTDSRDPNDILQALITQDGNEVALTVLGRAGRCYALERSISLAPPAWLEADRTETLPADRTLVFSDLVPPAPHAFYRICAIAP